MIEQTMNFEVITKTPKRIEFSVKMYIKNHELHFTLDGLENDEDYEEIDFITDILFDFVDDLKDKIIGRFEEDNDYMIRQEMFNLINFLRDDCYYDFYYERLRYFAINFHNDTIRIL